MSPRRGVDLPQRGAGELVEEVASTREALRDQARRTLGVTGQDDSPKLRPLLRENKVTLYPMVVLGILCFAVAIRGELLGMRVPQLGLIGAGPLAMFIGGFASNEVRWRDLLILALALTSACMILFGDLLNLSIPLFPQPLADALPDSWSQRTTLRATAATLAVGAVLVWLLGRIVPSRAARRA